MMLRRKFLVAGLIVAGLGYGAFKVHQKYVPDPAASHAIPAFTIPPKKPGETYIRFFAFGDSGTGGKGQKKVAEAMQANVAEGLDFIILLGDNFYPDGVKTADDPLWRPYIAEPYEVFGRPIYPSLGNHDHNGNWQAQVDHSKLDSLWRMPAAYYTMTQALGDGQEALFVAIDSDSIGNKAAGGDTQRAWLEQVLKASTARWKIVYGHHPLYSTGEHGDRDSIRGRLEKIFVDNEVDLYFCGHDHSLQFIGDRSGVRYVVSGGGGGEDNATNVDWRDDIQYAATRGGFVAARLSKDECVLEYIRPDGKVQYATSWTK